MPQTPHHPSASAPGSPVVRVVTVEGPRVPARHAVLKALQSGPGLVAVSDPEGDRSSDPGAWDVCTSLRLLLHRLRALARVPPGSTALLTGSWLAAAPPRAAAGDLRELHRRLAAALRAKLLPPGCRVRHLMLCLDACPHEAFEALLDGDAGAHRHVDLRDVERAAEAARAAEPEDAASPFGVDVIRLPCPRFAADNVSELSRLVNAACARVAEWTAEG